MVSIDIFNIYSNVTQEAQNILKNDQFRIKHITHAHLDTNL